MMRRPDNKDDEYELVGTRDWAGAGRDSRTEMEVEVGGRRREGEGEGHHEYSLPSLDAAWFPLVADRLRGGVAVAVGVGVGVGVGGAASTTTTTTTMLDFPDGAARQKLLLRARTREEAMDEIDGRGTFDRGEMEDELRSMHREELEDQLGEEGGEGFFLDAQPISQDVHLVMGLPPTPEQA